MPAEVDKAFYEYLDKIANTGDEDAIAQNKRIKEAEFAEDSREPTAEEDKELRKYIEQVRNEESRHTVANPSAGCGGKDTSSALQYHYSSMLPPISDMSPPSTQDHHHHPASHPNRDTTQIVPSQPPNHAIIHDPQASIQQPQDEHDKHRLHYYFPYHLHHHEEEK